MKRVHLLLTGLTLSIILLSINRLTPWTQGHLPPDDFLRWLDFNAMLPIPLITIVLYVLLLREVVAPISPFTRWFRPYLILFVIGVYLLGVASGDHEVTNYLHHRFCTPDPGTDLCAIIIFNDDSFATDIYYLGVIAVNVALMMFEVRHRRLPPASRRDLLLVSANAMVIALGVCANLAFEEIGRDLVYFSVLFLFAVSVILAADRKINRVPVTFYFAFAYGLGIAATVVVKVAT